MVLIRLLISAEVLGIPLLRTKLLSFGLSSFYAGVAGGLWAYFFRVVTPESFPLSMSIFFLAAVIVGGMGTILGGILGGNLGVEAIPQPWLYAGILVFATTGTIAAKPSVVELSMLAGFGVMGFLMRHLPLKWVLELTT